MSSLISGMFGLLGVVVGGVITAWIQHIRLKDERQHRAAQEERNGREREAIAAIHPWNRHMGNMLEALLRAPKTASDAKEKLDESCFNLLTRLAAAKVLTRDQATLESLTKLADVYNSGVTIVDDATVNLHHADAAGRSECLSRFRKLREQTDLTIRELERAATRR